MQNHEMKAQGRLSGAVTQPTSATDGIRDCKAMQAEAVAFVKRLAVATTATFGGLERRREPRIATDDPALMHVLNPLLEGRFPIRVLNISRNGMKLSAAVHLHPGTLVQIHMKNIVAMGEIRYCGKVDGEFHAGLHFDDVLLHHSREKLETV